jgi:hypothetical protein
MVADGNPRAFASRKPNIGQERGGESASGSVSPTFAPSAAIVQSGV